MHKALKVPLVLVISITILLAAVYTIGYVKLKSEYNRIYGVCLIQLPEITQTISESPSQNKQGLECIDNGGCYLGCGSCSGYKKSGYSFEEAFSSLIPLFSGKTCSVEICTPTCLYP